jgi:catechol 2,3-dioxygenase-like lactoylglutathione lyase family enzyme
LFYLVAAAVRAGGLFRVMLGEGQSLRECFFAGLADEIIVGHTDLPRSLNAYDRILRRWLKQVQLLPYALPTSYGGERASFSSLRASDSASAILNLEQGDSLPQWGRLIFHVTDVDAFWAHLREKGFDPEIPRDAPWGERYFHMRDPDGHELSFARPQQ